MGAPLSVIYVPDTGHALGVISRSSDPTVAPDLSHLGGGSVIVRNEYDVVAQTGGEEFSVASSLLKVTPASVPFDEQLLFMPLNYAVDNNLPHVIGASAGGGTVTLISDKISLTGFTPPSVDLKIWSQVQESPPLAGSAPEIRVSTGVLAKGMAAADVILTGSPGGTPIPIPTGRSYYVLVLVADYPPSFSTQPI